MVRKFACVVFLGLCAAQTALADLTLRYTFTFKFGSFLPAQAVDAIKQQVGSRMGDGTTLLIKGDRACTSMGQMFAVADYAKGTITLVDPMSKRVATASLAEYPAKVMAAQKLPALPPDAQRVFDNLKLDVKNSKTGQTATIREMRAEENLLVIAMEMTPGMAIRTEIHLWTAAADELQKKPELRELVAYMARAKGGLDPVEMMTRSLAAFPGVGEKLRAPMQEMMKSGGAVIGMRTATYMPAMPGAPAAGEPVVEIAMELAELSSEPLADSRFEVPAGYRTVAIEDLLAGLLAAPVPSPVPPGGGQ